MSDATRRRPTPADRPPQIGVDEWVAQRRGDAPRERPIAARVAAALGSVPRRGEARALSSPLVALFPLVTSDEYLLRVRHRHARLRPARARPERRRRLRRPARPRLRRVLRLRRLHLRDALARPTTASTGRTWALDPVVDRRHGRRSGFLLGAPVAAARRRLPRDRDALLRPDLRRLRHTRRTARTARSRRRPTTSPAARTASPTSTRSASSATS